LAALRRDDDDDELRRLEELRLEREESERESRASREEREDRERRESLPESVPSSSLKSSLSLLREELLRELREEDEPNESLLLRDDDRCAWTGSTVHAVSIPAASVTRRYENNRPRRLDLMFIPRRASTTLIQR
jgi:hypothetical protein